MATILGGQVCIGTGCLLYPGVHAPYHAVVIIAVISELYLSGRMADGQGRVKDQIATQAVVGSREAYKIVVVSWPRRLAVTEKFHSGQGHHSEDR